MNARKAMLIGVLLTGIGLTIGCRNERQKAAAALSVSDLLENPVYEVEIKVSGEVSLLGELFCPCFELTSGGRTILVWYGLMVEDDGTERPPVTVEGIQNGDQVIVTGELKSEGTHRSQDDFWASRIDRVERGRAK
jgi:hypothetical protein